MNKGRTKEAREQTRRREASEWFVRHESDDALPQTALAEWHRWMADPNNCDEFDAMVRLRRELLSLPHPVLPTEDDLQADSIDALGEDSSAGSLAQSESLVSKIFSRRRWFPMTMLAMATVVAACTVALFVSRSYVPQGDLMDPGQVYTTGPGEQREVTLADGSTVTLGGDTALVVRLAARARAVVLDRGEALFHVEHDASRPFTVFAGGGKITATGTAFDVRRYSNRVHVAVTEGSVEVAPRDAPVENVTVEDVLGRQGSQWIPVRVAHGQEMTYDQQGDASAPKPADSQVATAWTQGALIYHGRPLREVIEDVQRYSARKIVLDSTAAELHYTGTVIQQSVDLWIQRLPEIFPVEVLDAKADQVLIRSRLPRHREESSVVTVQQ